MLEPSYKILKIIESHQEYTQRQIAKELGYSLGKVNYVLSALVGKGIIKLQRFIKSKNKAGYRYVFTPQGIKQRYGIAKVRFSGAREKPFYSTFSRLSLQDGETQLKALEFEKKIHEQYAGGNLTAVELGEGERKPEELMSLTRRFVEVYGIDFLAYNRNLTYCTNCKRSWFGP